MHFGENLREEAKSFTRKDFANKESTKKTPTKTV